MTPALPEGAFPEMTPGETEQFEEDLDEAAAEDPQAEVSLDELLEESVAAAGGMSLDDLLEESMTSVREATQAKAARDRVKRGGQSAAERAEDMARIAAWEAAHEWKAEANVALFHNFNCKCGVRTSVFEGLFTRESHKVLSVSQRWRRVEASQANLPNEVAFRDIEKPMCTDCAESKGWATNNAYHWGY